MCFTNIPFLKPHDKCTISITSFQGLADRCEVQLAYAIGVAEPVSILVNCFGTNKVEEEKISEKGGSFSTFLLTPSHNSIFCKCPLHLTKGEPNEYHGF